MEKKEFRLIDCMLAVVCVVMTVEAAAPAASIGNSQFFWWLFLLFAFCVPYSLISAELGTTYENEGGIYDWVSRAYGKRWGSRVAWYYWINFPLWMASVAVLVTDNIPTVFNIQLSDFSLTILRLLFVWSVALLSLLNVSNNKLLFNVSTVFKAIIMIILGFGGIFMAITKKTATPFTLESMLPNLEFQSLGFISVILFNFMGFEVITTYVRDMADPKKDIPKAILGGGLVVTLLYLLASFGIGVAIPVEEISPSMGIMDSINLLLQNPARIIIVIIGIMMLFSMFTNQLSWAYGINYVARSCAVDGGGLPNVFKLSTKNDMPLGAALMNGILSSILIISSRIIPSEQLFWSFFALNLAMLLLSYVPLFPAFLKLRKIEPNIERPYKVFGGPKTLTLMAYMPMVLILISLFFTVIPLSAEEYADKIPLSIGMVLAVLSGEYIAHRTEKTSAPTYNTKKI